jgi:hypothetical protein
MLRSRFVYFILTILPLKIIVRKYCEITVLSLNGNEVFKTFHETVRRKDKFVILSDYVASNCLLKQRCFIVFFWLFYHEVYIQNIYDVYEYKV